MKIFVCIDDTDNLDSVGTGELAEMLARDIEEKGWGTCSMITRHQLFVHPDIPYTSHNSSMCFTADIEDGRLTELIEYAGEFLKNQMAEGSDPGLCVAEVGKLTNSEPLLLYAKKAKAQVVTKDEAYQLAREIGIHLSEHGGTGQGIIGALAGVGLRLSGNDGRFKGKLKVDTEDNYITVGEFLSKTKVDEVRSLDGKTLDDGEIIYLTNHIKAVLLDGKCVLLVYWDPEIGTEGGWKLCSKQQLSVY